MAGKTYAFAYKAVGENAPTGSGVYTIYTSRRWVYVGESDNIRKSLFGHLNDEAARMHDFGPLSFSFEAAPASARVALQQGLIAELHPACETAAA